MRSLLWACLLCIFTIPAQDTTRPGLRRPHCEETPQFRTITADSLHITAAGYSKPQGSNVESLFLSNSDTITVSGCYFTITYTALDGRMMHRRSVYIPDSIPAGETRLVTFKSWDAQHDFYYYLNEPPHRDHKMPYRITLRMDSARIGR